MTDINTDTGLILEQLNNKVDIDLNNINDNGKQVLIDIINKFIIENDILKTIYTRYPDYSTGEYITNGYEVSTNGWIYLQTESKRGTSILQINEIIVFSSSWTADYGSPDNSFIPVSTGDVIEFTGVSVMFFKNK